MAALVDESPLVDGQDPAHVSTSIEGTIVMTAGIKNTTTINLHNLAVAAAVANGLRIRSLQTAAWNADETARVGLEAPEVPH